MRNVKKYSINSIPEIHFFGRNIKGVENTSSRVLFWNGSGFEVHFKGRELWAQVEADYSTLEPWITVFLNGRINSRQMVTKGRHWICLARGCDNNYQTDIRFLKDSQPMTDDPKHCLIIKKLALSKGGSFEKLPEKDLKIEFIGDSITTGEGLYGAVGDMEWISTHMSFSKTYAYQTACKLNADFRVMSQGGYGIVSAWNNNPYGIIPPHYEKVCSIVKNPDPAKLSAYERLGGLQSYDFMSWQPDFIVINLGTNDRGGFYFEPWKDPISKTEYKMHLDENGKPSLEDGKKIQTGVKNFLTVIRCNNPSAKIIWATGMMHIPEVMNFINDGIQEYKTLAQDKNVFTLDFESMDVEKTDEDKGSRSHPGPLTHKLAREKLCNFINSLR